MTILLDESKDLHEEGKILSMQRKLQDYFKIFVLLDPFLFNTTNLLLVESIGGVETLMKVLSFLRESIDHPFILNKIQLHNNR